MPSAQQLNPDVRSKQMKLPLVAILVLAAVANGDEPRVHITPSVEGDSSSTTVAEERLNCCILDAGGPDIFGSATSFWIDSSGKVQTQVFRPRGGGKFEETRFTYSLTAVERLRLLQLLNRLRKDTRILRERYPVPEEDTPCLAFSISPFSDLFVREKHSNDVWRNFAAVSDFLSEIHNTRRKENRPVYKDAWSWDEQRWEPGGFVTRALVASIRYIQSEAYWANLGARLNSEQDGAGHVRTAPPAPWRFGR